MVGGQIGRTGHLAVKVVEMAFQKGRECVQIPLHPTEGMTAIGRCMQKLLHVLAIHFIVPVSNHFPFSFISIFKLFMNVPYHIQI